MSWKIFISSLPKTQKRCKVMFLTWNIGSTKTTLNQSIRLMNSHGMARLEGNSILNAMICCFLGVVMENIHFYPPKDAKRCEVMFLTWNIGSTKTTLNQSIRLMNSHEMARLEGNSILNAMICCFLGVVRKIFISSLPKTQKGAKSCF